MSRLSASKNSFSSGISLPYLGPDTLATLSDYQERRPATS